MPSTSPRPPRHRGGSPWTGLGTVLAKETADHLSSARMRILEALVFLTAIAAAYAAIRQKSPKLTDDRPLAPDIEAVTALISDNSFSKILSS